MNLQELDALAKGLAPVVSKLVDVATAPLLARLAVLEAVQPEPGAKGDPGADGRDGKDAEPVSDRQIADAVKAYLEANPVPAGKDGRDGVDGRDGRDGVDGQNGKDGESVTIEQLQPLVAEAVAALPVPADGRDGADGKDAEPVTREQVLGAIEAMPNVLDEVVRRHLEANPPAAGRDGVDGRDGKDGESITLEQVEPLIAETVQRAFSAIPTPKDGRDGIDGKDGADGVNGVDGRDGRDGADVADILRTHDGRFVATLSDGRVKDLGPVPIDGKDGRDGAPGRDGEDGLGFDDLDLTFDGERKLIATFSRGEISKAVEIEFPIVIHRGVYKAETGYARGDAVTWAGSSWIAQRDASPGEKPEGSDAWLLSVKRGRDGKDGAAGKPGERGAKGEPGRDGRSWG